MIVTLARGKAAGTGRATPPAVRQLFCLSAPAIPTCFSLLLLLLQKTEPFELDLGWKAEPPSLMYK